ncbi:hypothetical protein QNM99_03115 [Pseudomonas sp. PCH446]
MSHAQFDRQARTNRRRQYGVALGLAGVGLSNIVPILFTAAGNQPDVPSTFAERPTIFSYYSLVAENSNSSLPEGPNYQTSRGQAAVARVVGIHNLALRPGVVPETFEDFITGNIHRVEDYPGWKFHMLKGRAAAAWTSTPSCWKSKAWIP